MMGVVRFSLALIVLLAHAGLNLPTIGSLAAVELFFILSGIYMAAVYKSKYCLVYRGAQDFYLNRILRLYPTYLVLFFVTGAYFFTIGRANSDTTSRLFDLFEKGNLVSYPEMAIIWFSDLLLVGQDFLSVDETYHYMLPVRQSWSIATELLFYASIPFLFQRTSLDKCFVGFAFFMFLKLSLLKECNWRVAYFLPFCNFGYFLLGYGAYLISAHPKIEAFKAHAGVNMKRGVIALILLMLAFFGEASFERSEFTHHIAMVMSFTAACILLFERGEASKLDLFLGNLAFGIYLNHYLLIVVFSQFIGASLSRIGVAICVIVASLCSAFMMEKLLQEPIDRWRRMRTSKKLRNPLM